MCGTAETTRFGARTIENTAQTSTLNLANVTTIQHQEDDIIMEEYLNVLCDDTFSSPPEERSSYTPQRRHNKESVQNKDNLLQKQVENQIIFQENSVKVMYEIDQNLKTSLKVLTDVNQNLASINKYLKRSCDLDERKYKLAKEKFEFKKKIEVEKTKRKIEHLELKKEIFELESRKHGHGK